MSDVKQGKETSEWTVVKWILVVCGILGTALTSVLGALAASGALEQNSTLAIVLGAVAAVLGAVAGKSGAEYMKGRSLVKANASAAEAAKALEGNE